MVDWISDTRSQGYTGLQSLVKCLDHRDIMSDTACSQAKVVLGWCCKTLTAVVEGNSWDKWQSCKADAHCVHTQKLSEDYILG